MLTIPKTWLDGGYLTSKTMNEQVDQNLEWMRTRNIDILLVRNGISDWTQTALTTWQPIDSSVLYVTLTTNGGDIRLRANINVRNAGVAGTTLMDWLVQPYDEPAFYLSSLTNTPLANGLFEEKQGSNYTGRHNFEYLWTEVPANSYKFTLYWYSIVGLNGVNYTNTTVQLTAEEYGVWTP